MQIEKVYEPQRFEPHWAQWWIDSGVFHASDKASPSVFSLVIPPPNVTGSLHIGHMLEHAEIDVTIRWHRMRGDNTLWRRGARECCRRASAGIACAATTLSGSPAPITPASPPKWWSSANSPKRVSTAARWGARNSWSVFGNGRPNTATASSNK